MKHCRTCEKCTIDFVSFYIQDLEIYRCVCDGHLIEHVWLESCDKYEKGRDSRLSSFLYVIVQVAKERMKKNDKD